MIQWSLRQILRQSPHAQSMNIISKQSAVSEWEFLDAPPDRRFLAVAEAGLFVRCTDYHTWT